MLNDFDLDFQKVLSFIRKLKDLEEHGQGFGYPYGFIYRDEFVLLEKFVRLGYYGQKSSKKN